MNTVHAGQNQVLISFISSSKSHCHDQRNFTHNIGLDLESQKLSDDIDQYKINVSKNEPIKHIDRLHRWLDEDEYNWDNTAHEKVYGKNVCNWLIHSYVFRFQFDDNGVVSGFFVSSDYDRNKALYTISLADWINFVDAVITDDVVELVATFDDKRSDYIYRIKKRGKRRVLKP